MDTYFSAFPGYYDTMDAGVKDEHGYIKVCFFRLRIMQKFTMSLIMRLGIR